MKETGKVNRILTAILILGTVTVFFPLYMAVIIAFKKPSEMTNDVAGALAFPSSWSLDNFKEAMRVTDFWNSLGNSLLITLVTIGLAILVHSIAGYVIGRSMAHKKAFRFIYLYIVSGMFVPFAILMMPLVKQTAQMGLGNRLGVILLYLVFYMPMNILLYTGYLKKYTGNAGRSCFYRWGNYLADILENYIPNDVSNACDRCDFNGTWNLE